MNDCAVCRWDWSVSNCPSYAEIERSRTECQVCSQVVQPTYEALCAQPRTPYPYHD
jgi:hypothetical protein